MCGIFGFITSRPSKENLEIFTDLCNLSSVRGTDSTGIAVVSKNKLIIDKEPIPSPEFIKKRLPKYEDAIAKSHLAIGHTRKWTQGKPNDNNNNHPVISDNWIIVHNGMCSSMDRIKDYPYKGEVDSEILLSYIEKFGIANGASYLQGYAAIATINIKKLDRLFLWRHKEDIYLGYDKNKETLFFCSSEGIAEAGLANELLLFSTYQIRELPEDELYQLSYNPLCIEDLGEIEIKKPIQKYSHWGERFWNESKDKADTYTGNSWIWSEELQCLVPGKKEETDKSTDTTVTEATLITDRYYFPKQSSDFINWTRVSKCFVSPDGLLIKVWDKDKGAHFLVSLATALKEALIDDDTHKLINELKEIK